jgi:predicted N-acyltransferase
MKNSFIENIAQISNKDYQNILMDNDSPLISYEFLNALEESQSATKSNGWQPMHLMLKNKEDISGFLPLYLKNNSHGEFVFDHQWSYALKRAGTKLLSKTTFCHTIYPMRIKKIYNKKLHR